MRKSGNEERKRKEKTTGFKEERMPHARCTHTQEKEELQSLIKQRKAKIKKGKKRASR